MIDFKFFKRRKEKVWLTDLKATTCEDWNPVKSISNGIVSLKNDYFLTILEVTPINFKLRSKTEKRSIILNFREFLKACNFPIQISIQCRKASIDPHIKKMEAYCEAEENQNTKWMGKGYIELVKSLGTKGAVTRRFFLVIPYISDDSNKSIDIEVVKQQLSEKSANIKEYLKQCGNFVVDTYENNFDEFVLEIIKSCLRKNI